ncbi:hypothetical protein [Spongiactinospora sp. TRM90649]|uniref:RNA polymerase sigma factor n=1 Tax=Spongiactinospora sp. TRM90649 TaxID=3031114 RepID=UPI0023F6BDF2|nr:hypothetical protein [Spongiactinospora sp. TRM90649]MDF5758904.1 hypothetical protein [Spongiactinospora sp. TRM90649]
MSERILVEALRARDPGALAMLYDTYAEDIYQFCHFVLASSDGAEVALRDTLIAAEANVHVLGDPERLRLWLFALARVECERRARPAERSAAEGPPAVPGPVSGPGAVAWHAARSLPAGDRGLLDLAARRGLGPDEIALVTGVAAGAAQEAHDAARDRLRDAVTAEFLTRDAAADCRGRARILAGRAGELGDTARERLIRHIRRCRTCGPHRAGHISTAKVFDLLPVLPLPATLRVGVLSCFTDPELLPYRRHVAGRVGLLDARGFPAGAVKGDRRRPAAAAGAVAAVAALIGAFYASGLAAQAPGADVAATTPNTPEAVEPPVPRPSPPAAGAPAAHEGRAGRPSREGRSRASLRPLADTPSPFPPPRRFFTHRAAPPDRPRWRERVLPDPVRDSPTPIDVSPRPSRRAEPSPRPSPCPPSRRPMPPPSESEPTPDPGPNDDSGPLPETPQFTAPSGAEPTPSVT